MKTQDCASSADSMASWSPIMAADRWITVRRPSRCCPEIIAAVNGKIPVMVDSGFRRGSDVLKALALGADAVWLGRASRWALGAFGPVGVQKLLTEIMFKELVDATAATGRTTLASIDSSIIRQNWP